MKKAVEKLDMVDIKILECLKHNARENASVISGKVNMSVSSVIDRIKRLEGCGVIKQFTVALDSKKIGFDMAAYVSVNLEHPKYTAPFTEFVKRNPQIVECHYVAGDFDFLLKILSQSTETLAVLLSELKYTGGISGTKVSVVLSTIKDESVAVDA